jgi:DNA-directed RNA polymerase subunit L
MEMMISRTINNIILHHSKNSKDINKCIENIHMSKELLFISVFNLGGIPLALNHLESLRKQNIKNYRAYVTDKESYDILLEKEDYTLGKIIEYVLYSKFYEGLKMMTYCGFKKMHPHDDGSVIRVAYKQPIEKLGIQQHLVESIADAIKVYQKCIQEFMKIKT